MDLVDAYGNDFDVMWYWFNLDTSWIDYKLKEEGGG